EMLPRLEFRSALTARRKVRVESLPVFSYRGVSQYASGEPCEKRVVCAGLRSNPWPSFDVDWLNSPPFFVFVEVEEVVPPFPWGSGSPPINHFSSGLLPQPVHRSLDLLVGHW